MLDKYIVKDYIGFMFFILFRWNKKIGAGDTLKIPLHWSLIYFWKIAIEIDLGSVIIDCGDKHYNKGVTPGLAVCHAMGGVMTTLVA